MNIFKCSNEYCFSEIQNLQGIKTEENKNFISQEIPKFYLLLSLRTLIICNFANLLDYYFNIAISMISCIHTYGLIEKNLKSYDVSGEFSL